MAKADSGFTVLSVADCPEDKFTLKWLGKQWDKHRPQVIEIAEWQRDYIFSSVFGPIEFFRGTPLRVVETSFFGKNVSGKGKK